MKHHRILCLVLLALLGPAMAAPTPASPPSSAKTEEKVDLATQLDAERKTLREMLTRYTEKHPLVVKQRKQIADLEKQLAKRTKA